MTLVVVLGTALILYYIYLPRMASVMLEDLSCAYLRFRALFIVCEYLDFISSCVWDNDCFLGGVFLLYAPALFIATPA